MAMKTGQVEATVSMNELHRALGVNQISLRALYQSVGRGEIPAIRVGGRILIPRAWLTAKLKGTK